MEKKKLSGAWKLTIPDENVYGITPEPIDTSVPSTVYGTLLANGLMPDPYLRDNELEATRLMDGDFIYETRFTADKAFLEQDRAFLQFEGVDTLADIYLDDKKIVSADNMHRVWEADITDAIAGDQEGTEHALKVYLKSPTKFIREAYEKDPIGGSVDAMPGFPHLRKAACMFGWDWGPRLPDAGLFRDVRILGHSVARIGQVLIRQKHHKGPSGAVQKVDLTAIVEIEWMPEAKERKVKAVFTLTAPDGKTLTAQTDPVGIGPDTAPSANITGLEHSLQANKAQALLTVDDPALWWPNGYGDQPLYTARIELVQEGGKDALDVWEKRLGLRTVTVNTDYIPDERHDPHMTGQKPDISDGKNMLLPRNEEAVAVIQKDVPPVPSQNFSFEVNGVQIFAMGADYIPEDNILTRLSRERTEMLLDSAAEAHHNCMRIWGGGYYLDDYVYDICDEKGLLVWHDLMFCCAAYELSEEFEANIEAEIRQNIRRLRNHACIGMWCGNNENETQFEQWDWPKTPKQFYDYIRMYEHLIPKIVKEEDPDTFYWPSSPSSGGNFLNSMAENVGDAHYWGVWHGNEPFTAYRKHHFRFLSEFGFQSFPSMTTVRRFTEPEDRNIFSRIMEMHQRNSAANGKILNYLSQTYLYPKNFDELLYCSQLLQAEAIRYGVEHFRRFRGTCMGTVVWQLNDIWPAASWASLDYYGNWKALHYAEKKMFAPVLLSCEEHGEMDQKPFPNSLPIPVDISADLHVANETGAEIKGRVHWSLRRPDSSIICEGVFDVTVPAYGGVWCSHLDFNDQDPREAHLAYLLEVDDNVISSGASLFCAPKHYHLADPKLQVSRYGESITVVSEAFAMAVSVEAEGGVLRLDDNFVNMEAGTHTFHVLPGRDFTDPGQTFERAKLRARSLYETVERES